MKSIYTPIFSYCKNLRTTILLPLILCVASLDLFAMTTMPPVETCESCELHGITPQTYVTGTHAVIYAGRIYDSTQCRTYFFYCTINDGGTGGHDISNTSFGDFDCANTCLETTSQSTLGEWSVDNNNNIVLDDACGTVEHGTDPNTGICGVKHDEESEGPCYENENCSGTNYRVSHLYLSVEGNVPERTVTIGIKFGNGYETLEIPGPGDCRDDGCEENPETDPTLDVALINFSAVKSNQSSLIKWATALETNNDYFEIQRANDNKNFITIGKVMGAGNTTSTTYYEYTDNTPNAGLNAYRLRQVDEDGRATLSPIRMVNFNGSHVISIFPNPTTNELSISLDAWDPHLLTNFRVIDFNGSEVLTKEVNAETTRLNVAQLPIGTYFLQITNATTTQTYRFVKL